MSETTGWGDPVEVKPVVTLNDEIVARDEALREAVQAIGRP